MSRWRDQCHVPSSPCRSVCQGNEALNSLPADQILYVIAQDVRVADVLLLSPQVAAINVLFCTSGDADVATSFGASSSLPIDATHTFVLASGGAAAPFALVTLDAAIDE